MEPDLPFLTLSKSGSFVDKLSLQFATNNDIGIYDVNLIVKAIGGYTKPVTGIVPDLTYPVQVTVKPCVVTNLIKSDD